MPVSDKQVTSERAAEVLERVCSQRKIPGAALGVMVDGEVVAAAAVGTANLDTGLPVTDGTLFQAGSIGKSYTATVVMSLVDEGKLDLDTPVKNYLPDLELSDPTATWSVTARQLLSHTSDIDGDSIDEEGKYGRGDDCLARYVADLNDLPMIAETGTLWSYCNSGYILLGRLIEVLTGTTFETAVAQRLLQPLGLQRTFYFAEDVIPFSVAVGHLPQPGKAPAVSPKWAFSRASHPAGGNISTTIEELLAFARLHLDGGVAPDGTRILTDKSVRAMQEPAANCPEPELLGDRWGLGWFLRTRSGSTVIGHDGNTIGQTAGLRLIPERNAACAVFANLNGQNHAFTDLTRELLDPWLGTETPGKPEPAGVASPADPGRFQGLYEKFGARVRISSHDGVLHAGLEPVGDRPAEVDPKPRPLRAVDDHRFSMHLDEIDDDMLITFVETDTSGRPQFLHTGARAFRRVE